MHALLRTIHRYLGLLLALPMLAQGLSGAILALEPMLNDEDVAPASVEASHGSAPISIDAIVAAARSVAPPGTRETRFLPPAPGGLATVWFAPSTDTKGRGAVLIRVDPESLTPVLPPEPRAGPLDWVRRLHTDFMLSEFGGRCLVGWAGVALLLLSIIGIPVWWPARGEWRQSLTLSTSARGHRFHRRLHGTVGIWAVTFLMVSSTTGALLGFPRTVRSALGLSSPVRVVPSGLQAENSGSVRRLDTAMVLATAAAPGMVPRLMLLPANGGTIRVSMAPPNTEGVARSVMVTIDGNATRVLNVQRPETLSGTELALRWAHDIHFGQGLGIIWRLLTVATGLALSVFVVTGTAMWLLRNRNRKRARFVRRDALSSGA